MNILIVEDEYWALEELKALLANYQQEHQLFFFDDGEEAYAHVLQHEPDLVITDITMPVMDGIELIRSVKRLYPVTECVLLTVHDSFDYAKQAIDLNVSYYLLKPVKRDTLNDMMSRLLGKIADRKKHASDEQLWFINQLIVNPSTVNKELFVNETLYVTYIVLGNWHAPIEDDDIIMQELEKINQQTKGWLLSLDKQRILFLTKKEVITKTLFQQWSEVRQVHLATVKKGEDQRLGDVYQQVHQLMDQHKWFGRSSFITDQSQASQVTLHSLWDEVRVLEKSLRNGEYTSVDTQLSILTEQIHYLQPTQKVLRQFLLDMYYAIWFKLEQSTSKVIKIPQMDSHFAALDRLLTIKELRGWLQKLLAFIMQSLDDEELAPRQLIPKVKEFIETHYADNITFQQFADDHHVSLSYLSREFKLQTSMNFSDYLTNYRIEKAKELFENGFTKTVEVGILVGYQDPKHFRSVFKKATNYSPKQYKDLQQKTRRE
ncbi:response regulator transcription factor [Gracilibacillus salinarum]|uniref:Response regulator n=1 Tax=Gracilibacillus salinarum TaxID=2932255 RepID=A0ABY4GRS2_9BACI|nr:response regulator [Gracilibacillus salinarum]UOQ86939.1 response regulator [Gracilibacillus salinarum]